LAARSGVAEAALSRLHRPSVPNENASWGEQKAEVSGTAVASSNISSSANTEKTLSAGIAALNSNEKISTHLALKNSKNAVADVANGDVSTSENLTVTSNAIESISESAAVENQHVSASSMPKPSFLMDGTVSESLSENMLEDNSCASQSSSSSSRANASLLSEALRASNRSNRSPHSKPQTARKENVISRTQTKVPVNASESALANGNSAAAPASFKTTSRSIEVDGNNGNERISSRPPNIPDVSELVSQPSSRQPTQVHIGKIELEIHAAPQKATHPAPVQISPSPVVTTKRSASFSPSRHYLRSR
jgi:hypothetical protein